MAPPKPIVTFDQIPELNINKAPEIIKHNFNIITASNFLSPFYSYQLLLYCISLSSLELVSHPETREYAKRNHYRSSFKNMELAEYLFKNGVEGVLSNLGIQVFYKGKRRMVADGLNPNFRLYYYGEGDEFGSHYDEETVDEYSRYGVFTVLIYLSGGNTSSLRGKIAKTQKNNFQILGFSKELIGGRTIFTEAGASCEISPEIGKLLLHRQGDECVLHKGEKVVNGVKWVLRSDVMYK